MKLVREHINEKFSEESDPIRDMGIGIYVKRHFNNEKDLHDFLYYADIFLITLGLDESYYRYPNKLLNYYLENKDMEKAEDYFDNYLSYGDGKIRVWNHFHMPNFIHYLKLKQKTSK